MNGPNILVAITGYEDFSYTARAVKSALEHTPESFVLVIDDASPSWPRGGTPQEFAFIEDCGGRAGIAIFAENYGLTRSMNKGVEMAMTMQAKYCCVTNNDVIFTPGWSDGLVYALDHGYDLAGPLSNAPGPTARGQQDISYWMEDYVLTDDPAQLVVTADYLRQHYVDHPPVEERVNGFCFMARTEGWIANAYDANTCEVFKLEVTHNSRGRPNPTPRATLMEDHYQHRLYDRGGKSAVVPSSFVFHYRSVRRGDRYKHGKWYRPA